MSKITKIQATKILDSRAQWTLRTRVFLENGTVGIGEVPSGISTGKKEAALIPVDEALDKVNNEINSALKGENSEEQEKLDQAMLDLDGTENKSNLGANTILSVSLAVCEASAKSKKLPLYKYIREHLELKNENWKMPTPMLLILEGGEHAVNIMDFQEFMITPKGNSFEEKIESGRKLYNIVGKILERNTYTTAVGSEGGFSPQKIDLHQAFRLLEQAFEEAKTPETGITLDVAANSFCTGTLYNLEGIERKINANDLLLLYKDLINLHPNLCSIEDPFDENHQDSWKKIKESLGQRVDIIGDDILTTDKSRLKNALNKNLITGVIVKPNQIGTLSETLDFTKEARKNELTVIVSHRAGETNSSFISDLAVAVNADYIKTGAPARGERVAKYNRLLEIERSLEEK